VRASWDRARDLLLFSWLYLELVMNFNLITFDFVAMNSKFGFSHVWD